MGQRILDPKAIAIDAAWGIAGVGIAAGINKLRQLPAIASALEKVAEVRSALNISASRNIAFIEGQIEGRAVNLTAVSGQGSPIGTAALPSTTQFTTIATGANTRALDSERKLLEAVASGIDETAEGALKLFTERSPCISCESVASQFSEAFPGVSLKLSSAVPEGLGLGGAITGGLSGGTIENILQGANYFSDLSGTGGSGQQNLKGISPAR